MFVVMWRGYVEPALGEGLVVGMLLAAVSLRADGAMFVFMWRGYVEAGLGAGLVGGMLLAAVS